MAAGQVWACKKDTPSHPDHRALEALMLHMAGTVVCVPWHVVAWKQPERGWGLGRRQCGHRGLGPSLSCLQSALGAPGSPACRDRRLAEPASTWVRQLGGWLQLFWPVCFCQPPPWELPGSATGHDTAEGQIGQQGACHLLPHHTTSTPPLHWASGPRWPCLVLPHATPLCA